MEYSRAKDEMISYTDIKQALWFMVNADIKRYARLNCMAHLLSMIPYQEINRPEIGLPERQQKTYVRPPIEDITWVPDVYPQPEQIKNKT